MCILHIPTTSVYLPQHQCICHNIRNTFAPLPRRDAICQANWMARLATTYINFQRECGALSDVLEKRKSATGPDRPKPKHIKYKRYETRFFEVKKWDPKKHFSAIQNAKKWLIFVKPFETRFLEVQNEVQKTLYRNIKSKNMTQRVIRIFDWKASPSDKAPLRGAHPGSLSCARRYLYLLIASHKRAPSDPWINRFQPRYARRGETMMYCDFNACAH